MPSQIEIVSVNVGQPQPLPDLRDPHRRSSINKTPVGKDILFLGRDGLEGDMQVDTRLKADGTQLHGGEKKAVYAYPFEHYRVWEREWGREFASPWLPAFGENITIRGIDEDQVHIGDIWEWGTAKLQVSTPRQPCRTLTLHLGGSVRDDMWDSGMCGWYLRVLQPGLVPTTGVIRVVEVATGEHTVAETFSAKRSKNR